MRFYYFYSKMVGRSFYIYEWRKVHRNQIWYNNFWENRHLAIMHNSWKYFKRSNQIFISINHLIHAQFIELHIFGAIALLLRHTVMMWYLSDMNPTDQYLIYHSPKRTKLKMETVFENILILTLSRYEGFKVHHHWQT